MAILRDASFVERVQFFDGQRLFAKDLDELERFHREMRWLHNQSLHQPGIGRGMAVSGKKGDKTVAIQEGYAIDSDGREIVLTVPRVEQIPPVASDEGKPFVYDLTVAYPSDEQQLEITETRQGVCGGNGAVRRREEPVLCWVLVGPDGQAIDPGLRGKTASGALIRLARVQVLDCQLYRDISITERRDARPPQQPYIAGDRVSPDWIIEEPFNVPEGDELHNLGTHLRAVISTAQAGFRTAPCYSVQLVGTRLFRTPDLTFVLDGVPRVIDATPTELTIEVSLVVQVLEQSSGTVVTMDEERFTDWDVMWIGVEG